jgi:hypothetical protein
MSEHWGDDGHLGKQALVVRVTDSNFQREVLERLGRLETKMDMLAGSEQPGRMAVAESRLRELERNDVRHGLYERVINAAISIAISMAIGWHERWGK